MSRLPPTKREDRSRSGTYLNSARTFLAAGEALLTLADDDESYGNAIALLAIHAAIAHADAVTIAVAGKKSSSGDHQDVARLVRAVLGNRLPDKTERELIAVIKEKDSVAYQGKYFALADARLTLGRAQRFARWAEEELQDV